MDMCGTNEALQAQIKELYKRLDREHESSGLDVIKQDILDTQARLRDYEMDGGVYPDRPAVHHLNLRIALLGMLYKQRLAEVRELRRLLVDGNKTGVVH